MTGNALFLLVFEVFGGLALFIFGMHLMTEGLRNAAGSKLRTILHRATKNRMAGISLGSVLGFLVQSSAATVMIVGFINAGLMTLPQSVPLMLGANVGTTLSMQLISFKLGAYCFVAITIGFMMNMVHPQPQWKEAGRALMGFGLLFLGMNIMSDAIKPYREVLAPLLAEVDGSTLRGTLLGVGLATGITAIIQSSGATIGMVFAMINAGIIVDLSGAYPIILGANIGTCMTAMLGSIGTNIEARRSAISHLTFNLFSAAFGILTAPLIYRTMPLLSHDLIHQAANANTIKMIASAIIILPVYKGFAKIVQVISPSRHAIPEPSFLDDALLARPEQSIAATILELRRVARICETNLLTVTSLFDGISRRKIQQIKLNEAAINAVKLSLQHYLCDLTGHYLSKRQGILIQHISDCMSNLERIGDHIDRICEITVDRLNDPQGNFDKETLEHLFTLFRLAAQVLQLMIDSFNPDNKDFQQMAKDIMEKRDEYVNFSIESKLFITEKLASKGVGMPPITGMYINHYIQSIDRIVRHAKTIALVEQKPQFWIKHKKLNRIAEEAPVFDIPAKIDVTDYLDQLQAEDRH